MLYPQRSLAKIPICLLLHSNKTCFIVKNNMYPDFYSFYFCRLSKEMSSKLNDKNPNITDLSDSNRPTKIAEKYNELYDNEWTDALEDLTEERYLEEGAIAELLACVQVSYLIWMLYIKAFGYLS